MKRLIRLFAKVYPKPWRDRYGEEFEALLDDVGAGGRVSFNVLTGAISMQFRRWKTWVGTGMLAILCISFASRWTAQRPYNTPGAHQIFHMDSTPGALLEFLVILSLIIIGAITLMTRRSRWVCPCIATLYLGGVIVGSLLAPEKIISVGDSYCWDLWCVGIQNVNAVRQGENTLYNAELSIFVDSISAQLVLMGQPKQFFYVIDDQGRRFPIVAYSQGSDSSVVVKPGESVKCSLTFLAPASARNLYMTGDIQAPPWVRLYFGSDLNPFHRRTLLRIV
jgi:hypothetical protein